MKHAAVAALEALEEAELRRVLERLTEAERRALAGHWPAWAHDGQLAPEGPWRTWTMLAGRGFGKTRAGAEWVSAFARAHPEASIALVAATAEEARSVMIEGRSGLLAVARVDEREAMVWEPTRRRLVFASGAVASVYSAANPDSLRGPEHHIAWCDELAKWPRGQAAWDNLKLGLRLGDKPRALVTTTPRAVAALKRILARGDTATSGGPTWANPHNSEDFVEGAIEAHKGTRFGRQELEGVLLEDVEGALWPWALMEKSRQIGGGVTSPGSHYGSAANTLPRAELRRVVVGVDPPASAGGDACGILVCGLDGEGIGYVLADLSIAGASPEGWARKVAAAAEAWGADRVVAEKNNGGDMVASVLRGAGVGLPVTLVHAADGKAARAEPVAVLFESGRAKLAGRFPELEEELAGLSYGGGYQGPGRSPDRADAMVWALTELMVRRQRAEPGIRQL
ncbi:MAG TPA: terminase family protein [Allosphingosinicella sp.]|nr:terminase family protein [Allosphingosinicella sp.]